MKQTTKKLVMAGLTFEISVMAGLTRHPLLIMGWRVKPAMTGLLGIFLLVPLFGVGSLRRLASYDVAWTLRRTWLLGIFLLIFCSCNDNFDNYSTNPNDVLTFSTDTVAFDTIISTVRTPYKAFMIRNSHKKPLLISSISLETGGNSAFHINVDGRAGQSFESIEIRANDSLYVLVDVTPHLAQSNDPQLLSDKIIFVTNKIQQSIVLQATAQDCEMWTGKHIVSDTTLTNQKPFVIYDSLVVDAGATLHIAEGVKFYMHSNAEIIVHGTLQAHGTLEKPIIVRGDRFDYWIGIPYDRIPGQWGGIRFSENSFDNELERVHIRNGKFGLYFEPSTPNQLKIKLKSIVLTNFKGALLNAANCRIEVENSELSNAKDGLVWLDGGDYSFIHCTLANYYPGNAETGWGSSEQLTVQLTGDNPIHADFYNTIIWGGSKNSEITFDSQDGVTFGNCITHEDPLFLKSNWKDYAYDFHLHLLSPAIHAADPTYSLLVPFDLDGIDRFKDGKPDIGAYEDWVISF
ncbi:hypothetical protein FACS1894162_2430 [Bacteroidia bacterium]|nr:hypothetical protein FACS1894162_2430 [Bacteroidia bacterium]